MINFKKSDVYNIEIKKLKKITTVFSVIRFFIVIFLIVFIVCALSLDNFILYLGISLIFLLSFVICVIISNPFYLKLKQINQILFIYKKHENRRNLNYRGFMPDGKEFLQYTDYKVLDLDLLGPRSLFQYLCSAKTKDGKEKLAKQLTTPTPKSDKFKNCVKSLAQNEDSLKLEAAISLISNDSKDCDSATILGLINKKITIPMLGIILMICSYLAVISLSIIMLINGIVPYSLFGFLVINFIIAKKFANNEVFNLNTTKYADLLSSYYELAKVMIDTNINDDFYKDIKSKLEEELPSIKRYLNIFELLSYRKNFILSFIGNGLIYLDYLIVLIFNLQKNNLKSIEKSLDYLSEIELMLSLANIGIDNETYCLPQNDDFIKIKNGYHPLVKNCVKNDFYLNGGIVLTGSNMSGKTTFMRTLGINQILANAGGLVCAEEFYTSNYDVVTSLRANDMLQEGISTFYAEINRMKFIIKRAKETRVLVLVDEIFKGTNAKDRIYSAKEIIKKLNAMGAIFIITTHDFEICEAENILNYHFDEEYIDNKIYFDYKIKNGKCNKTNAIYLLRMSGVLED